MKLNSKYFDRIRIKPDKDQPKPQDSRCEWPGCAQKGAYRAPKGRNAEGQYFQFCMDHVRAYNKSYNYFDGMADNDIGEWIKASSTGHRPTWKLGENSWAEARRARERKGGGNTRDHRDQVTIQIAGETVPPGRQWRQPRHGRPLPRNRAGLRLPQDGRCVLICCNAIACAPCSAGLEQHHQMNQPTGRPGQHRPAEYFPEIASP